MLNYGIHMTFVNVFYASYIKITSSMQYLYRVVLCQLVSSVGNSPVLWSIYYQCIVDKLVFAHDFTIYPLFLHMRGTE